MANGTTLSPRPNRLNSESNPASSARSCKCNLLTVTYRSQFGVQTTGATSIFSRHVVGWLIAERESAELAEQLVAHTVARHDVQPGMLTLHADRGASMRSKPVAALLVDLDIAKSHSRPHVSDDNPYSESQFETMKYRPDFPARFGCIEDARLDCQQFFAWYNTMYRHSGIGYMTPHSVHYGHATACANNARPRWIKPFRPIPNDSMAGALNPPRCPRPSGSTRQPRRKSHPKQHKTAQ